MDSYVLHGGWYKALGAVLLGFFPAIAIGMIAAPGPLGQRIVGAVLLATMGTFEVRWIRAQVRVEPDGLTLRTPLRTHHLAWDEVKQAQAVGSNANQIFAVVAVTTNDGRKIKMDGVASSYRGTENGTTPVSLTVAAINEHLLGVSIR